MLSVRKKSLVDRLDVFFDIAVVGYLLFFVEQSDIYQHCDQHVYLLLDIGFLTRFYDFPDDFVPGVEWYHAVIGRRNAGNIFSHSFPP
ncbi:MAG TPA: hypothetical protein PKC25_15825 [Candidatus Rifleibacterium sp.]|nr:hypothetical protein [Candidatus Rifleibacterium sp.]